MKITIKELKSIIQESVKEFVSETTMSPQQLLSGILDGTVDPLTLKSDDPAVYQNLLGFVKSKLSSGGGSSMKPTGQESKPATMQNESLNKLKAFIKEAVKTELGRK